MSKKSYICEPILKVGEWSVDQGGKAYIYFEEYVNIPGFENADISIQFNKNNSFEEISELVSKLKGNGFKFVVQK